VLDAAGHILADVGGPYVIAPVTGVCGPAGAPEASITALGSRSAVR
jgi:hypothetical protein